MVSGEFVVVSPLVAPTTRVTVSNVPPFIPNDEIERVLSRYGKFASAIKTLRLGCKNEALKHVMSFRRQVFMFLNEPNLDISFRVMYEGKAYMIYANAGSMKCFECGDVGHKRLTCPHKAGTSEVNAGPSAAVVMANASEDALPPVVEERDTQVVKQAESITDDSQNENMVAETELRENEVMNDVVSDLVYEEVASANVDASKGEESCDTEIKEDDTLSEISDMGSQLMYTLQEIIDFLDTTFGKTVDVSDFFSGCREIHCDSIVVTKNGQL